MLAQRLLRAFAIAVIGAVAAAGISDAFADQSAVAANKVVVQVSDADPGKWNRALNNVG